MTSIGIIVSDNGYGHARRMVALASELSVRGALVTLFGEEDAFKVFLGRTPNSVDNLKLVDFRTRTSAAGFRNSAPDTLRWIDRLPDMQAFDVVVCDNLPEILERVPDAILSGHFFWHDVLDDAPEEYRADCRALLEAAKPRMIGSEIFAMPEARETTAFTGVGLFSYGESVRKGGEGLLVASGLGGEAELKAREMVARLSREECPVGFDSVYVDASLLPAEPPAWMRRATFTPEMFGQLKAVVCRPGQGTLTDCYQFSEARIFAFYETGNQEMTYVAGRLAALDIGADCPDAEAALQAAIAYAGDAERRDDHRRAVEVLAFDGASVAANFIISEAASC